MRWYIWDFTDFLEPEMMLCAEPQDVSNNLKSNPVCFCEAANTGVEIGNLRVRSEDVYHSGKFIWLPPLSPHLFTVKTFQESFFPSTSLHHFSDHS